MGRFTFFFGNTWSISAQFWDLCTARFDLKSHYTDPGRGCSGAKDSTAIKSFWTSSMVFWNSFAKLMKCERHFHYHFWYGSFHRMVIIHAPSIIFKHHNITCIHKIPQFTLYLLFTVFFPKIDYLTKETRSLIWPLKRTALRRKLCIGRQPISRLLRYIPVQY